MPDMNYAPGDNHLRRQERFIFDEWCRKHLYAWYNLGGAPFGVEPADIERFAEWVDENQDTIPWNASWPDLFALWADS